jgi:hypothetical protein
MRAIVSVGTGPFVKGLDRLTEWCAANGEEYFTWRDRLPAGSPKHQDVPYAFKAYAMREAIAAGVKTLLYLDSSIIPIKPLGPLWERIERDGYFIAHQAGPEPDKGYTNYEWTADSVYGALFPEYRPIHTVRGHDLDSVGLGFARSVNRLMPHVVAGCIGLSMEHPTGKAIFEEYYRLASETKAFCGPWTNAAQLGGPKRENIDRVGPCGPPDVRGHRHDQTALSVIAWRLGCKLIRWPEIFAYEGHQDESTILVCGRV